ncbi:MAG: hypothetical protein ACI8QS_001554 [Planctomycetota bacterium]|jgi:hypothetical protein
MTASEDQDALFDWRDQWARMRGAHATARWYFAKCTAWGGRAGQEQLGDRAARESGGGLSIQLHLAAGERLRFQTDAPELGTHAAVRAGVVIWGRAAPYFAWRLGAGLVSLGSDIEVARSRCG